MYLVTGFEQVKKILLRIIDSKDDLAQRGK